MYVLSSTCAPGHYRNSFMATGALGHANLRLHVVDIQDPNKAQVSTRRTRIIIHTNLYTNTHTHTYIYIYKKKNKIMYQKAPPITKHTDVPQKSPNLS